jgi:hypothetical protein
MGRHRPRQPAKPMPPILSTQLESHMSDSRTSPSSTRKFLHLEAHTADLRHISSLALGLHTHRATMEDDDSDSESKGFASNRSSRERGRRSPEKNLGHGLLSPLAAITPELTIGRNPTNRELDPVGSSREYPTP